jgi:acyl carrier protein
MTEQRPSESLGWQEYVARRERILVSLQEVLARQLRFSRQVDEIDPDAPLFGAGFGLDSLDAVELSVHVESTFGVKVSEHVLLRGALRSLNTLIDLVLSVQGVVLPATSAHAAVARGGVDVAGE